MRSWARPLGVLRVHRRAIPAPQVRVHGEGSLYRMKSCRVQKRAIELHTQGKVRELVAAAVIAMAGQTAKPEVRVVFGCCWRGALRRTRAQRRKVGASLGRAGHAAGG